MIISIYKPFNFLQDWEGAKGELRDFGDAYGKRRNMEADILENDSGVNSFNCPGQ